MTGFLPIASLWFCSCLQMHVSFSLNGTAYVAKENRPTIVSDIIDFFLSSVGATLTEITDVELK